MKNPAVAVLVIALTPIALVILVFAGTEANKAYWDWQVRKLCEEEGGVIVYETVNLSASEYLDNDGKDGAIRVMSEDTSKDKHEYAWKSRTVEINKSNPYVRRTEYMFFKKSDKKNLGKKVTFSRRGGDFPIGIGHHSSFGCNDMEDFSDSNIVKKYSRSIKNENRKF